MITPRDSMICRCPIPAVLVCLCASLAFGQGSPENPSHRFAPDQCGPADPAYIRTANETGGVPLFLQRNEAAKAMQLMRESTRENVSTVLWASAKLTGGGQTFEIPVDSAAERITFTFSVDTKTSRMVLTDPSGQIVTGASAHTEDTELNCGRIITVEKPEAGAWRAEITGRGTYWLETQAQSDIYFIKAEFVEVRGRPGHEGFFKIRGQPIAGKRPTLQVSLSAAAARTTEFAFVSERAEPLQRFELKPTNEDREFLEFLGDVTLPTVPFRIAVMGRDTNGKAYQRFDGPLFHAETVEVTPKLDFDQIAPGAVQVATFEVRNAGAARSFKVQATDTRRFITQVDPEEFDLGANATGTVRVHLTVPSTTTANMADNLVILVRSTSGAATTNSAIANLSVTSAPAAH